MRIYEFAKKVGFSSKIVLEKLKEGGFSFKSHMSVLGAAELDFLEKAFSLKKEKSSSEKIEQKEKKDLDKKPVKSNFKPEVKSQIKAKDSTGESSDMINIEKNKTKLKKSSALNKKESFKKKNYSKSENKKAENLASKAPSGPVKIYSNETLTVSRLAEKLKINQNQLSLFLLKKGKFYAVNSVISSQDIKEISTELGFEFSQPIAESKPSAGSVLKKSGTLGDPRPPIIVIMGHVDHGKTTLIDHIRNTKIAEKEAGGITQSVRLFNVETSMGEVVIVDTPGHEAFSSMRGKGAQLTDIVVLIVAADDGVMPQTIESIKFAKEMNSTIIVAINKIDKPGVEKNLDKIKQQLSQHDLLTEDWGGETVCVSISAKTGQGVDELLEMVHLQSEMMDLRARKSGPGSFFVLESQVEKGLGATAIGVVKEGEIEKASFFRAGNQAGKIKALFNFKGSPVKKIGVCQAGKIVGLKNPVKAGTILEVCSEKEAFSHKAIEPAISVSKRTFSSVEIQDEGVFNVIVKSETAGALEAILKSFEILKSKNEKIGKRINVVSASVGDVFEKDVQQAIDSDSIIVGMDIKIEKSASDLAKFGKIKIVKDSVLYRLIEAIEESVLEKLKSIKQLKEVGTAKVLKVFDLKKKGVVAGCIVEDGFFEMESIVHCFRDGRKIGGGRVKSLQTERSVVKSINSGNECGFVCENFRDWQIGDTAICYLEVGLDKD